MSTAVGAPIDRVDGRLKVTGAAKYAADHTADQIACGAPVVSAVAKGRIRSINTRLAEAAPGVIVVITRATRPVSSKRPTILVPGPSWARPGCSLKMT